jgi:hypothetical protein
MLTGMIFSRDRALQLDAVLRSYLLHCQDADQFDLYVVYTTSGELHTQQYARLIAEFRNHPFVHFIRERGFRREVLGFLAERAGLPTWRMQVFRWLLPLGHRLGALGNRLLGGNLSNYILFLVDDNIFVRDFCLEDALQSLAQHPDALAFSLRLGKNTTFSYMLDKSQALPDFSEIAPEIMKFDWTRAEQDFNYPLEVSSSMFRIAHVLPNLNCRWFINPNWMESRFAACRSLYQHSHPALLCFSQSVTFCAPVNRVQPGYQNRAGVSYSYTTQFLAEQFEAGKRVDVAAYSNFVPIGCHQEVELVFKSREG